MAVHTLVKFIVHPTQGWERGNIFQVCELEDDGQGAFWIRNHRAADGVPNDRTARRGWARWTLDSGHVAGKWGGEREAFAFEIVRDTHPDSLRHLVGRKVIKLTPEAIHAGRGVELAAILDRAKRSPIIEGRLTRAALLAAPRGANWGRDQSDVVTEMLSG